MKSRLVIHDVVLKSDMLPNCTLHTEKSYSLCHMLSIHVGKSGVNSHKESLETDESIIDSFQIHQTKVHFYMLTEHNYM